MIAFSLIAISIWLLGSYSRRKIGGFTGDVLGATCELVELVPMFGVVILARLGGM
jgi:adenosylcobinamide-GDP ribazoletransferase